MIVSSIANALISASCLHSLDMQSGAKVARTALDEVKRADKPAAAGVLTLEGYHKTWDVLSRGEVELTELDFIVCNAGSDMYLRVGSEMQRSKEWSRKSRFRWDADIVKKAIFRAADRRHSVTAPQRPEWSANEELKEILESVRLKWIV